MKNKIDKLSFFIVSVLLMVFIGQPTASMATPSSDSQTIGLKVSAGYGFSCALDFDNDLWCWGRNEFGQLGNGLNSHEQSPVKVSTSTKFNEISTGLQHSCAITTTESLMCWGQNSYGQLGTGSNADENSPVSVSGLLQIKQVSTGFYNTCAVDSSGSVWCWGVNSSGQLGDDTYLSKNTPTKVTSIGLTKEVSVGQNHACALLRDETVACWGSNFEGQAGAASLSNIRVPSVIPGLHGVIKVSSGQNHTCALVRGGEVKCWGSNIFGQIGFPPSSNPSEVRDLEGVEDALSVSSSGNYSCFINLVGSVKCWGTNNTSQLALATSIESAGITEILGLEGALSVSLGPSHACAVLPDGGIKCWGETYGAFASRPADSQTRGQAIPNLQDAVDVQVQGGFACILRLAGTVRCLGYGDRNQLGGSDYRTDIAGLSGVNKISVGSFSNCALLANGQIKCWGWGAYGQLGVRIDDSIRTPATVPDVSSAIDVAAGSYHSCAVLESGTVKCWGWDSYGRLGNGSSSDSWDGPILTPTLVNGIDNARKISAGNSATCALLEDATIKCWGYGDNGQIGSNEAGRTSLPTRVDGISNAVDVVVGWDYACAILETKQVKCWGNNDSGQLGDGTKTTNRTPVLVDNLEDVSTISLTERTPCATLENGSIKCWGVSEGGLLGGSAYGFSLKPKEIQGFWDAKKGSSTSQISCVLNTDRSVTCFTRNGTATFATNDLVKLSSPQYVQGLYSFKFILGTSTVKFRLGARLSLMGEAVYSAKVRKLGTEQWVDVEENPLYGNFTQIQNLDPSTQYILKVEAHLGDDLTEAAYYNFTTQGAEKFQYESRQIGLEAINVTWTKREAQSFDDASDYKAFYKIEGSNEWFFFEDPVTSSKSIQISGLVKATTYEVKIRQVVNGYESDAFQFSTATAGLGVWEVRVSDFSGNPISGGSYTWVATDNSARSAKPREGSALGVVTFTGVPAKNVTLTIQNGSLADGTSVTGSFTTRATNGSSNLSVPLFGSITSKTVEVKLPDGTPVSNSNVSVSGLNGSRRIVTGNFTGTFTRPAITSGSTGNDGRFTFAGFATGPIFISASYDDGELLQTPPAVLATHEVTQVQFEYMPIVQINSSDLTADVNTIVSIPISVGDSGGASMLKLGPSGYKKLIGRASYSGVQVTIIPPKNASQKTCKGSPTTSLRTNQNGSGILKVCASASGEYQIRSKGAISSGAIKIRVRKSKPMAVTSLAAVTNSRNSIFAAWGDVEFDGSSAIKSYVVTAVSGSLSKSVTINAGTSNFSTKSVSLGGLSGGIIWKISVSATNKYGTSPASSKQVLVSGGALFSKMTQPTVNGTYSSGKVLSANPGKWSPTPVFSYQWLRNGSPILGANSSRYTLKAEDRGSKVNCRVTTSLYGFETVSVATPEKLVK